MHKKSIDDIYRDIQLEQRAGVKKLLSMRIDSIMEISNKSDFLQKHGLKIIE